MVEMLRGEHPQPPPLAAHFMLVRASVALFMDVADIARDGGPVLDPLLITAVVEANVAPINQDPILQQKYGGLDTPPPDELRRPVSINAVAASLGQPFETVRRRLNALAAKGECVIGPKGVVVPTARLASDDYGRILMLRYERVRRLYADLAAADALGDMPTDTGPRLTGAGDGRFTGPPVRLVNRLLSEYYLRALELIGRRVGDPLTGLIVMGLARLNMAGQTPQERAANHLLPDGARKPIRRSELARSLGLPSETVRRRLLDLEARGYCRTSREGVVFSIDRVAAPDAQRLLHDNNVNLMRMMSRLARYGVLDYWDDAAVADLRTA
jgi:DNA-binding Lrp family transcriptional regulator